LYKLNGFYTRVARLEWAVEGRAHVKVGAQGRGICLSQIQYFMGYQIARGGSGELPAGKKWVALGEAGRHWPRCHSTPASTFIDSQRSPRVQQPSPPLPLVSAATPLPPRYRQVVREGWVHKKSKSKVNAQDRRLYAVLSSRALYFFAEVRNRHEGGGVTGVNVRGRRRRTGACMLRCPLGRSTFPQCASIDGGGGRASWGSCEREDAGGGGGCVSFPLYTSQPRLNTLARSLTPPPPPASPSRSPPTPSPPPTSVWRA
jgi:hypothetical protein